MKMFISDKEAEIMNNHNAYFDQEFTGAEKIQMVIDEIRKKRIQLIAGNVIELRSINFHTNFKHSEQEQVLKLLQEQPKCIEYKISQLGEDVNELDPTHYNKMHFGQDMEYPSYSTDKKKLKLYADDAVRYSVTILENFDEAVKGLGTENEIVYSFNKNGNSGRYYINDIPLGKPQDNSMTDKVLKAAFKNENKFVYFGNIENKANQKISLQKILNDFHLKKPVWSLFFNIEKDGFTFCSKITNRDIRERQIDTKSVNCELSKI